MTTQWQQLSDQTDAVGAPLEITEYIILGPGVLVRTSVRSNDNYTWATALEFVPMTTKQIETFVVDREADGEGE